MTSHTERSTEPARILVTGATGCVGGLADDSQELSPHLRSRIEVGQVLRGSGVPVIELGASIVIGSGSLSFEMIRALVEHLPILIAPRWVSVTAQPIGIDDLIAYLLEAKDLDPSGSPIYEIGGSDRMSYADLMKEYARQRGLRRVMLRVPVLTPRLSSLWLGLVTPLYARIGRKLIDSIRHPTVVRDDAALSASSVEPSNIATAISRALDLENGGVRPGEEKKWLDQLSAHLSNSRPRIRQDAGWHGRKNAPATIGDSAAHKRRSTA